MSTNTAKEQTLRLFSQNAQGPALDIEMFMADCESRRLAARTLTIYRHQLARFHEWAHPRTAANVTAHDVRTYMLHLAREHNAGGQHQAYRVLRTFFRWLLAEGVIAENPISRVKPPRVRDEPLEPVPLPDVAAMLATCESRDPLDLRDKALLLVLLDTACRAGELLAATVGDLDLKAGALVLRVTKSGKRRVVFVGVKARRAVLAYLRKRGDLSDSAPLFATRGGTRLSYWGLRQMLRRRADRAEVTAPSAHAFRRAACLALLRNGADVFTVQALAGHADLSTTRRYLKLLSDDLQREHAEYSPADRLLSR